MMTAVPHNGSSLHREPCEVCKEETIVQKGACTRCHTVKPWRLVRADGPHYMRNIKNSMKRG